MKKRTKTIGRVLLLFTAALLLFTGIADGSSRDRVFTAAAARQKGLVSYRADPAACFTDTAVPLFKSYEGTALLFGAIPLKSVDLHVYQGTKVALGGFPFGVKMFTDGVMIVGFSEITAGGRTCHPATDAGLRRKDVITAVGGHSVSTAEEVTGLIEASGGSTMEITYQRGGESHTTRLTPVRSDESGKFQTGMWIRDSTAGIGTVTFYLPESGVFAGLGHGICDTETGELLPLLRGLVTDVTISGIEKGVSGDPGELKGYFSSGKAGSLIGNTNCGIFGIYTGKPSAGDDSRQYTFGFRDEIHDGAATVICTLDDSGPNSYEVMLSNISQNSVNNKNFLVTVTDQSLLEKTGGIVQGMSGSPLIQDGKLVGAVTHVLINDPTKGYGIFIENMLANLPEILRQ